MEIFGIPHQAFLGQLMLGLVNGAFYAMLGLTEGDFVLDPNFRAPQQVVHASPEALLLEGMRRQDEAGR